MKKITFILLAFISGTAFAQNSDFDDAQVFAEIVSPIVIEKTADLNFGKIAAGPAAGTVKVLADNSYTAIYDVAGMEIPSNTVAPAKFKINAPLGTSYSISIVGDKISSGENEMSIEYIHNKSDSGNIGKGVFNQLIVGGILTVAGSQPSGDYAGSVTVTVTYE